MDKDNYKRYHNPSRDVEQLVNNGVWNPEHANDEYPDQDEDGGFTEKNGEIKDFFLDIVLHWGFILEFNFPLIVQSGSLYRFSEP